MCEESAEPVAEVRVQEGQLFWHVIGGRANGWQSYLAVQAQQGKHIPIELDGDGVVVPSNEGQRVVFRVREKGTARAFLIEACDFVYAAQRGEEMVTARPVESVR
jgi:hypothetical protein